MDEWLTLPQAASVLRGTAQHVLALLRLEKLEARGEGDDLQISSHSLMGLLRANAFHEAGHAVVAHKLRRGVRLLTIIPYWIIDDGESIGIGLCGYEDEGVFEESDMSEDALAWKRRCIVTCFAGGAAEQQAMGRVDLDGVYVDESRAETTAIMVVGPDYKARKRLLDESLETARRLVSEHSGGVEAIAGRLLTERDLTDCIQELLVDELGV